MTKVRGPPGLFDTQDTGTGLTSDNSTSRHWHAMSRCSPGTSPRRTGNWSNWQGWLLLSSAGTSPATRRSSPS